MSFLSLPIEIRNQIYQHIYSDYILHICDQPHAAHVSTPPGPDAFLASPSENDYPVNCPHNPLPEILQDGTLSAAPSRPLNLYVYEDEKTSIRGGAMSFPKEALLIAKPGQYRNQIRESDVVLRPTSVLTVLSRVNRQMRDEMADLLNEVPMFDAVNIDIFELTGFVRRLETAGDTSTAHLPDWVKHQVFAARGLDLTLKLRPDDGWEEDYDEQIEGADLQRYRETLDLLLGQKKDSGILAQLDRVRFMFAFDVQQLKGHYFDNWLMVEANIVELIDGRPEVEVELWAVEMA